MCFINKLDRTGANFFMCVDMIKERLGANPLPVVLPIGAGDIFTGIIDLLSMKAILYNESSLGAHFEIGDIPSDMKDEAEKWRHHLIEETAGYDEALLEKYLDEQEITENELKNAIRKGCLDNTFVPTFCGSAFKNKGVQRLLDAVNDFLPSPLDIGAITGYDPNNSDVEMNRQPSEEEPFSALAFKIMTDPFVGSLTFARIYSGTVSTKDSVLNSTGGKKESIGRMLLMHANNREEIKEAGAGDIVALVGLKDVTTGETLCDPNKPIILEKMDFPDPVIEVAVEPKTKVDHEKMGQALARLAQELSLIHI